jgi:hypothetical protein
MAALPMGSRLRGNDEVGAAVTKIEVAMTSGAAGMMKWVRQ